MLTVTLSFTIDYPRVAPQIKQFVIRDGDMQKNDQIRGDLLELLKNKDN